MMTLEKREGQGGSYGGRIVKLVGICLAIR